MTGEPGKYRPEPVSVFGRQKSDESKLQYDAPANP
jgi:hypothetical protein